MRFFELCSGDDVGGFSAISGGIANMPYQYEIEGRLLYVPGKKKTGDCFSFLSFMDIFSEKVVDKLGKNLESWGQLLPIVSEHALEKFYLFDPKKIHGLDLEKSKALRSIVDNKPIAFSELKYSERLLGNEIFQPGVSPACSTLYSEDFVVALYRMGAKGYYLREWSEDNKRRAMLNRDLSVLTHTNKTMRTI